jgi:hypothetical protein
VGTRHVQETSLLLRALVYTAEANSEEFRHVSQRGECFLHLAVRELYFVLLPSDGAPKVTVTRLRVRDVTSSTLGLELFIFLENAVCIYVLFDIVDEY